MAKGKKKGLADRVRNKKKSIAKPQVNPFEVKVNRVKHTVVNKKLQKWEQGNPGLSRSKAVKMRQDTLLRELHHMKKSNSLHDKRFGETDSNLTADEKMVQRFALEKKKQAQKGDFSLKDEEEPLTHYGQSLAENLQDTIGTDSEEEEGGPTLRTGDLQFGGFSKSGEEVSWKDKMRDVIVDSKQHKYERQVEKEKALETTNELNSNWKSVHYIFIPKKRVNKPLSSYQQLFHNLVHEQKSAGGTDKLKTEEERAKEEAERLQKLEAERLSRMEGSDKSQAKPDHRSADDLADCFALDDPGHKDKELEEESGDDKRDDEDDDSNDNDEEEEREEEEGSAKEPEQDTEEEEDDDEEDDESDNYSDLASDDGSDSEAEVSDTNNVSGGSKGKESSSKTKEKIAEKVSESKNRDLPYVFAAPGSFEELESLLHGHNVEEQAIILSRLRKCHHPSLAEGNKEKLQSIHLYILQYFGKLVAQVPMEKSLVGHVTTCLWEMMQMFKDVTAAALQKYITQRQADFNVIAQKRRGRGLFPTVETLMHLTLVDTLFPTSDFRHPVCTPTLHFITQILTECPVKTGSDLVCGLFLCSLALKFVSLSKRFIPEVLTFLQGILVAPSPNNHNLPRFPPFQSQMTNLLNVESKYECDQLMSEWSIAEMMNQDKTFYDSDQFKCECVTVCVQLVSQCLDLWKALPCLNQVTEPIEKALNALSVKNYPEQLQVKIASLKEQLQNCKEAKLKVMQQPSKKPEPLRLFEPKIDEIWSGKKKKGGPNRQANERQRLNHKFKREMKAAVREIKRDNQVLAKHQLEQVMKKDQDRKRKVKELMHGLASQEGDYKAIKRMKN